MSSTSEIAAVVAALVFFVPSAVASAQDLPDEQQGDMEDAAVAVEEVAEAEAEADELEDDGGWLFTPFIAPSFAPEFGLGLFAGALMTWRTDRSDPDLNRSIIPVSVGVSTTGSVQGSVYFVSFWMHDTIRFNTIALGGRIPDNYWGVGYDAGRNTERGEQTTSYLRLYWSVEPGLLMEVFDSFYAGFQLDWNQTVAEDVNPRMANDPAFQATGSNNLNSGVGVQALYDTRDNAGFPYRGLYLFSKATFFVRWLGGDNTFWKWTNQYRQYATLGRDGSTLAWIAATCNTFGTTPWSSMCMLGSVDDLRGYYTGQYRDKTSVYAIVEYRIMMENVRLLGMRQGFVFFVGAGSVGQKYKDLTNWLPNGGFGYRLEIQPRMNARIDVGFGLEGMSLYITFLEAF